MTYQPVVPFSGYSGWAFLNRTMDAQKAAFNSSAVVQRDVEYFEENIGNVTSAEQLVDDRRLLSVALGAFGLDEDIDNKFFIQKVLSDGTLDDDALGNRLSDTRYYELSKAFGFGDFETPNTVLSDFPQEIVASYQDEQFEQAIGDVDGDLRLALNLDRSLSEIVEKSTSDDGRWYSIMGNEPLRTVFETALSLPSSFASIDLDQQLTQFREKSERFFGGSEISQFENQEKRDELVRLFLVKSEINSFASSTSSAANALSLLSGAL